MRAKRDNSLLKEKVTTMEKQGLNVSEIKFEAIGNGSQERQAHSPTPLPIQLEDERKKRKKPKQYDMSTRELLESKVKNRFETSIANRAQ